MTVLNIDCRAGLGLLPDCSVDAILTDGPYELGFMGKAWDRSGIVFDVAMWREALRVLKPGGHLLSFGGSRTYHRMACAVEDGGFEIRDSIAWVYSQGMPKSRDLGAGWGTGLKPCHEQIVMARKPIEGTNVTDNMARHRVGGIHIEACRVPIDPAADATQIRTMSVSRHDGADGWGMNTTGPRDGVRVLGLEGRWPGNFIHDGSPAVLDLFPEPAAARFFQSCPWEEEDFEAMQFMYCAKPSKREKGVDNRHPTVKPVTLGRYLARLITPAGGMLVDLFAGSGSFGVAAKLEGFDFLGFDTDAEHVDYANRRLALTSAQL